MFKLLLVDDEDIEREGMASMIPWHQCGMELAGTAWNGIEGLEKIQMLSPDVVITDIKMPVMNGIELIRKGKEYDGTIIFIVLSGFGEYEFTSQAMELGVRHYILKPCDEEKIIEVLGKVQEELLERQKEREKDLQYRRQMRRLLPRAREQIFTNILLKKEQISGDYSLFMEEIGETAQVGILAFKAGQPFDYMEDFALSNIMEELFVRENVLLHTVIDRMALYLIRGESLRELDALVRKAELEFGRFKQVSMQAAVSRTAPFSDVLLLYEEICSLFAFQMKGEVPRVLSSSACCEAGEDAGLFDLGKLQEAKGYDKLLFELYLGWCKMQLCRMGADERKEAVKRMYLILCGEPYQEQRPEPGWKLQTPRDEEPMTEDFRREWQYFEDAALKIAKKRKWDGEAKEEQRMQEIFLAVYRNFSDSRLSIQFLAKEELFMNEDYLGRLFQKYQKEKYSSYLQKTRITLAKRLLGYDPELKVSQLARLAGYPPDGQYFAKAFKKITGVSPSEYRESEKNRGRAES